MKNSAVEKLVEEINKLTGLNISMDEPCVEQAKEIEEKEKGLEYIRGWYNGFNCR